MVSYPMSVRVHFITAFFYFPCVNNRCCFLSGSRHTRQYLCMERHSCLMWTNSLYDDIFSLYDDSLSLYDDTFSLYDDTSSLYDDTFSLYDDTFPLYDDTFSLYGDTSSSHARIFSNKTRSTQVIV